MALSLKYGVGTVSLHHHFRVNGSPSRYGREIIWSQHFGNTRWIHAAVCVCTHTTATTLSGSHRPHQYHSITRGTLWNHLPNHLVTSTQRNATGPPHGQFRGLAAGRFGTAGGDRGSSSVMGVGGGMARGGRSRMRRLLYFATRDPVCIVTLLISRYIVMMTI